MENGQFDKQQQEFFETSLLLLHAHKEYFKTESNELKKELNKVTNAYNLMILHTKSLVNKIEEMEKRLNLYLKTDEHELPTEEKSKAQLKKEEQRFLIYECLMEAINSQRRVNGMENLKVDNTLPKFSTRGNLGTLDEIYSEFKDDLDTLQKIFWYIINSYLRSNEQIQKFAYSADTIIKNFGKYKASALDYFKKMNAKAERNYDNDR